MSKFLVLIKTNAFSMAIAFNMFSMTLYLISLSLVGNSEIAADVGIIQGALLAAFMAFSANARNLILASDNESELRKHFVFRVLLLLPLSLGAFFLSSTVAEVNVLIIILLVLRRCAEWVAELHISEREKSGDLPYAFRFIFLQLLSLLLLIASFGFVSEELFLSILGFWAITPILQSLPFFYRMRNSRVRLALRSFLPHLGSSWVISISTYVFRVLIVLLAGRVIGGMLISAYAIGGMLNAVYTYALGPSQALKAKISGGSTLSSALLGTVATLLLSGLLLVYVASVSDFEGRDSVLFVQAIGFSLMGGGLMILAMQRRIHMLQILHVSTFVPDVLSNILLVATVPFAFYLFGMNALSMLFLWSAVLAFVFYSISDFFLRQSSENGISGSSGGNFISRQWIQPVILVLVLSPVFFQLSGNIFNDPTMIFDTQGKLSRLPLPLSAIFSFLGIALLVRFEAVKISTSFLFSVFVTMLLTTFAAINMSGTEQEIGKLILLMQYILPVFALILGQCYLEPEKVYFKFETILLYVIAVVIPFEVIATILQETQHILTPYLYVFSIYQHLQYMPVIFVGSYFLVLFSLFSDESMRKILLFLAPFVGSYAWASSSLLAIFMLLGGAVLAPLVLWRHEKLQFGLMIFALTFSSICLYAAVISPNLTIYKLSTYTSDTNGSLAMANNPNNFKAREFYWGKYLDGIRDSPESFFLGHTNPPSRSELTSAHNYYLDIAYNFGFIALIPFLVLIAYTFRLLWQKRIMVLSSPGYMALAGLVLFFLIVDNSLKVTLRQPYPGIVIFFMWGVLLSRLSEAHNGDKKIDTRLVSQ